MVVLEVAACVASIISAFGTGLDVFKGIKEKRRARQRLKRSQEHLQLRRELQIQQSLERSPFEIQAEYDRYVGRLGERFAAGDPVAHSSLAHTLLVLNSGIARILSASLSSPDARRHPYHDVNDSLLNLSNKSKTDAIIALAQLHQRLLESSMTIQPSWSPRHRADDSCQCFAESGRNNNKKSHHHRHHHQEKPGSNPKDDGSDHIVARRGKQADSKPTVSAHQASPKNKKVRVEYAWVRNRQRPLMVSSSSSSSSASSAMSSRSNISPETTSSSSSSATAVPSSVSSPPSKIPTDKRPSRERKAPQNSQTGPLKTSKSHFQPQPSPPLFPQFPTFFDDDHVGELPIPATPVRESQQPQQQQQQQQRQQRRRQGRHPTHPTPGETPPPPSRRRTAGISININSPSTCTAPSIYSFMTDSTKLGEIPESRWLPGATRPGGPVAPPPPPPPVFSLPRTQLPPHDTTNINIDLSGIMTKEKENEKPSSGPGSGTGLGRKLFRNPFKSG